MVAAAGTSVIWVPVVRFAIVMGVVVVAFTYFRMLVPSWKYTCRLLTVATVPEATGGSVDLVSVGNSSFMNTLLASPFFTSGTSMSSLLHAVNAAAIATIVNTLNKLFFIIIVIKLLIKK